MRPNPGQFLKITATTKSLLKFEVDQYLNHHLDPGFALPHRYLSFSTDSLIVYKSTYEQHFSYVPQVNIHFYKFCYFMATATVSEYIYKIENKNPRISRAADNTFNTSVNFAVKPDVYTIFYMYQVHIKFV